MLSKTTPRRELGVQKRVPRTLQKRKQRVRETLLRTLPVRKQRTIPNPAKQRVRKKEMLQTFQKRAK
jgi:hypothetical protein